MQRVRRELSKSEVRERKADLQRHAEICFDELQQFLRFLKVGKTVTTSIRPRAMRLASMIGRVRVRFASLFGVRGCTNEHHNLCRHSLEHGKAECIRISDSDSVTSVQYCDLVNVRLVLATIIKSKGCADAVCLPGNFFNEDNEDEEEWSVSMELKQIATTLGMSSGNAQSRRVEPKLREINSELKRMAHKAYRVRLDTMLSPYRSKFS